MYQGGIKNPFLINVIAILQHRTSTHKPLIKILGQTDQTGEVGNLDRRTEATKYFISLASWSIITWHIVPKDWIANSFTPTRAQAVVHANVWLIFLS